MLGLMPTVIILVIALGFTVWANWRSRRPYQPGNPPLVPPAAIQFIGLLVAFLMIAHLITLLTGQPFAGRRGY